jgi:hypothetical protein
MAIAARAMGRVPRTQILPDDADPGLLARVAIGERAPVDGEAAALFACIPRRRTNRGTFVAEPIPAQATAGSPRRPPRRAHPLSR